MAAHGPGTAFQSAEVWRENFDARFPGQASNQRDLGEAKTDSEGNPPKAL